MQSMTINMRVIATAEEKQIRIIITVFQKKSTLKMSQSYPLNVEESILSEILYQVRITRPTVETLQWAIAIIGQSSKYSLLWISWLVTSTRTVTVALWWHQEAMHVYKPASLSDTCSAKTRAIPTVCAESPLDLMLPKHRHQTLNDNHWYARAVIIYNHWVRKTFWVNVDYFWRHTVINMPKDWEEICIF